jgi:hypothetical protein
MGPSIVVQLSPALSKTAKKYAAPGTTAGSETFTPSVPSNVTLLTAVKPR